MKIVKMRYYIATAVALITLLLHLLFDYYITFQCDHSLLLLTDDFIGHYLSNIGGGVTLIDRVVVELFRVGIVGELIISCAVVNLYYQIRKISESHIFAITLSSILLYLYSYYNLAPSTAMLLSLVSITPRVISKLGARWSVAALIVIYPMLFLLFGYWSTILVLSIAISILTGGVVLIKERILISCLVVSLPISLYLVTNVIQVDLFRELYSLSSLQSISICYPALPNGYNLIYILLLVSTVLTPSLKRYIKIDMLSTLSTRVISTVILLSTVAALYYTVSVSSARILINIADMANREQWSNILESSDVEGRNILNYYYRNLSLERCNTLSEKMFEYDQSLGVGGLILTWTGNRYISEHGDRVYANIGLVNEAHHWSYESMIALGETAISLKKLINYNIAIGNYGAARLFLNRLSCSPLYRSWSISKLAQLPEEIDDNRSEEYRGDKFIDTRDELHNLRRALELADGSRSAYRGSAFEYYMAGLLLKNRVDEFANRVVEYRDRGYSSLPKHWQEAYLIYALKSGIKRGKLTEVGVTPEVINRFQNYIKLYKLKSVDKLERDFSDTFWYYLHFKSPYGNRID